MITLAELSEIAARTPNMRIHRLVAMLKIRAITSEIASSLRRPKPRIRVKAGRSVR